jgi:hypothetical protein
MGMIIETRLFVRKGLSMIASLQQLDRSLLKTP